MQLLRRHWYDIGGLVAIATIVYLVLAWRHLATSTALLMANFAALLIHQFEEYGWPGGEPAIMNLVLQPSRSLTVIP